MNLLAERVKLSRKKSGLTQSEVAKFIGISRAGFTQWETGETKSIHSEHLFDAARALNCEPEWLATGKGDMHIKTSKSGDQVDTLKTLMGRHSLGVAELAKLSSVPQPTIHRILTNEIKSPKIEILDKLARALGLDLIRFLKCSYDESVLLTSKVDDPTIKDIVNKLQGFNKSEKNQVLTQVKLILAKKQLDRLTAKNR